MSEPSAARRFHDATNLTWEKEDEENARGLDWSILPAPFKEYPGLDPEPAPHWLRLAAGRTRELRRGDHSILLRTYSSAGARYPIELYVADARGLHHFDARDATLTRIRDEDVRARLVPGTRAESVLVLTGIFERTAWKYTQRGYRHLWWDAGTLLANLLALAESPLLLTSFPDDEVDAVVGADGDVEVSLALLCVGEGDPAPESGELRRIALTDTRHAYGLSRYDEVRAFHDASKQGGPAVAAPAAPAIVLLQQEVADDAFLRRSSVRSYADRELPLEEVASYLAAAAAPVPADRAPVNRIVLAAHRVAGLEPGFYDFAPPTGFAPIRLGDVRGEVTALLLDQEFGGTGTGVVFMLADVDALDARGWRWAQLEGGIRAGRLYLHAAARGWGASGSTFLDEDVSAALATDDEPMLAVAFGPR